MKMRDLGLSGGQILRSCSCLLSTNFTALRHLKPYIQVKVNRDMYMDSDIPCWICGKMIRGRKETADSEYKMYEENDVLHTHNKITVSEVLASIHYPDDEDKSKSIKDMTLEELESRIDKIAYKIAAMNLGTYLHAQTGYPDMGFEHNFFRKRFMVDEDEYYITGKIDGVVDGVIHEAKFTGSSRNEKKNKKYAMDQCDIYSWMADITKCKIVVHVIPSNTTNTTDYTAKPENGEKIVYEYVRNMKLVQD